MIFARNGENIINALIGLFAIPTISKLKAVNENINLYHEEKLSPHSLFMRRITSTMWNCHFAICCYFRYKLCNILCYLSALWERMKFPSTGFRWASVEEALWHIKDIDINKGFAAWQTDKVIDKETAKL